MRHILKSSDATNNVINLKKTFEGRYDLHSFGFTNTLYNITSNNNILPYQEGATYTAIELTTQYTNGTDVATDIETKINAVSSGTASVSYSESTGKFTITNTTNFYLKFGDVSTNTCSNLLGFSSNNTTDGTSITSDVFADLEPFKTIYIDIKQDKLKSISDESYNSHTFMVLGTSNFGELFIYKSLDWDFEPQYMTLNETKRLQITFYDENKNALTLTNWFLVLQQH